TLVSVRCPRARAQNRLRRSRPGWHAHAPGGRSSSRYLRTSLGAWLGCLQSLALNGRLRLTTGAWLRHTLTWAGWALAGGLVGLALIRLLYPSAVGLPGQ